MNIREQVKIGKLYQQKYLVRGSIAYEDNELVSFCSEDNPKTALHNKIKFHTFKQSPIRLLKKHQQTNKEKQYRKNSQNQSTSPIRPTLLKKQRALNNKSMPMRIDSLHYIQQDLGYEKIINKIRRNSTDYKNSQRKNITSKQSQRANKNAKNRKNMNKSLSSVIRSKSVRDRENWLQSFKQMFMKDSNKYYQNRKINQQKMDRLKQRQNQYKSYMIQQCDQRMIETQNHQKLTQSRIQTSNNTQNRKRKLNSCQTYRVQTKKRALNSSYRQRSQKNNQIMISKRQKNDQSELKPWNYEVQQF